MSENNEFLSLDTIFAAPDINTDVVDVPEWGGKVQVKGISKGDQMAIRKKAMVKNVVDETKFEGLLLVAGVVSPELKEHHIPQLFKKSSGAIDRVLGKVMELSGMTDESAKDAEADLKSESGDEESVLSS